MYKKQTVPGFIYYQMLSMSQISFRSRSKFRYKSTFKSIDPDPYPKADAKISSDPY